MTSTLSNHAASSFDSLHEARSRPPRMCSCIRRRRLLLPIPFPPVQDNRVGELACEQFGLRGRPEDCGPEAATLCVVSSHQSPQCTLSHFYPHIARLITRSFACACVWYLLLVLKLRECASNLNPEYKREKPTGAETKTQHRCNSNLSTFYVRRV